MSVVSESAGTSVARETAGTSVAAQREVPGTLAAAARETGGTSPGGALGEAAGTSVAALREAPGTSRASVAATIVDLGVGNLGNLARALAAVGGAPCVTSDPALVADSRCLLLPGVGAFRPPREALRGPVEAALRAALASGAWLLGICVGFQLLFEASEEFGETDGLGLLPGRVTRLPSTVPVPHIGWNRLHDLAPHPLTAGLAEESGERDGLGSYVYFVHSFAPEGVPAAACLALCTHGRSFAAVVGSGRVLGAQFHPERSGPAGLRLLRNFLEMARGKEWS